MATQAKITFTALNGEANLSERVLTLHPHLRTMQIGRASKTPSKGLQAAVDNAWFDSPVMSRNHAEISLDAESNVITIQDIGSMHGTFVNGFQLQQLVPHGLSNGDLVVFGAEVKRNLDTFPACVFRANYEFLPFKANISYAFPESDDDDYASSDDDMEKNEQPSSEDGVSIESPPQKVSQAIHAIDLTRDDSPAASTTGETSVEKDLMKIMDGRPADIDHHADPVSIAIYAGNPPILVESDGEDTHFSSDSDDQSDEVENDDGASAGGDSMDEQENSENEDDIDHEMCREENSTPELRDFPDKESEQASALASRGLYTFCSQPVPQSNLRKIIDASENIAENDDHDDENDFGLSDAGAEGIRALFDDGLVDNVVDPYLEEIDNESDSDSVIACEAPVNATLTGEKVETPKQVTFAGLFSDQVPEITSSYSFNEYARASQTKDSPNQTAFNARQPSPSDAAMVKTATPTIFNQAVNPVRVHHLPSQDFQKLTSQSLGDKTGKHAFFAAREVNKAKIYPREDDKPDGISSPQAAEKEITSTADEKRQCSMMASKRYRERRQQAVEKEAKIMLAEIGLPAPSSATRAVNFTIPPLPTIPYLDDHTQVPKAIHTPSPEPDMTSAVVYNESKASMTSVNRCTSTQFGRSILSIHDIIEGAAGDHTSKSLKRKAEGISDAIDNEIRAWATSSPALDKSTDISAPECQGAIREEQSKTAPLPVSDTEQQPPKRLRKIVESVGYVALGGATLFGALVLSAPDFL